MYFVVVPSLKLIDLTVSDFVSEELSYPFLPVTLGLCCVSLPHFLS